MDNPKLQKLIDFRNVAMTALIDLQEACILHDTSYYSERMEIVHGVNTATDAIFNEIDEALQKMTGSAKMMPPNRALSLNWPYDEKGQLKI